MRVLSDSTKRQSNRNGAIVLTTSHQGDRESIIEYFIKEEIILEPGILNFDSR
jgi:hypothetical protein